MKPRKIPLYLAWLVSPALLIGAVTALLLAERIGWSYGAAIGTVTVFTAIILVILEWRYPLDERWKMTWPSFRRDLKYFATTGLTIAATSSLFALVGIKLASDHQGVASNWPLILAVPAGLFVFDLLQYWQHRFSHEAKGVIGAWYWRAHVAHHLPDKVYVAMHPAGHPINGFVVRGLATIAPLYALGFSAQAVAFINLVIGIVGLISHTNIDLRAGPLNYVLTGSELHRYHHSADPADGGNYAIVLSLIDVMFGTLKYRPGIPPVALGVHNPSAYPSSNALFEVLKLPFGSALTGPTARQADEIAVRS